MPRDGATRGSRPTVGCPGLWAGLIACSHARSPQASSGVPTRRSWRPGRLQREECTGSCNSCDPGRRDKRPSSPRHGRRRFETYPAQPSGAVTCQAPSSWSARVCVGSSPVPPRPAAPGRTRWRGAGGGRSWLPGAPSVFMDSSRGCSASALMFCLAATPCQARLLQPGRDSWASASRCRLPAPNGHCVRGCLRMTAYRTVGATGADPRRSVPATSPALSSQRRYADRSLRLVLELRGRLRSGPCPLYPRFPESS